MTLSIEARRQALVDEALTWKGTPYAPRGRVKGPNGGVDCLVLLADVFAGAGEIPWIENIPHYPHDWHLNQTDELYLNGKDGVPGVRAWCDEMPPPEARVPLPGDIAMFKFGHCFAHGAIVVKWPLVIHAYLRRPVGRDDAERTSALKFTIERSGHRNELRSRKIFTLKTWT